MFQATELTTVNELANHMGGKFINNNGDSTSYVYIEFVDGRSIGFHSAWNSRGKVTVRGHYPLLNGHEIDPRMTKYVSYDAILPSIGVSLTKSVHLIAKDIENRLFPSYNELYANMLTHKSEAESYANTLQSEIDYIAKVMNTEPNVNGVLYSSINDIRINANVHIGSTRLELSGLSKKQVESILGFIKTI